MLKRGLDRIDLTRDATTGVEAIRARFHGHAYDLHRHEEWLVGVTEQGVQDFFCRGTRQVSTTGRVILIEPEEAHDGQAGAEEGFCYRMLYIPQRRMREGLGDAGGDPGFAGTHGDPGFAATLCDDPALGRTIAEAAAALLRPEARLVRDAALDSVIAGLRRHLQRPARRDRLEDRPVARRARDILHACLDQDIGADALARAAGAPDRFHLARAFRAAHGTSPHAWLVQQRLLRARRALAAGTPPAEVAAACGFADQSHLGRWFRRAYGVTPAAYRARCTGVPDEAAGNA